MVNRWIELRFAIWVLKMRSKFSFTGAVNRECLLKLAQVPNKLIYNNKLVQARTKLVMASTDVAKAEKQ